MALAAAAGVDGCACAAGMVKAVISAAAIPRWTRDSLFSGTTPVSRNAVPLRYRDRADEIILQRGTRLRARHEGLSP